MFFSKSPVVIYFQKNSLQIYFNENKFEELKIPQEILLHLEIIQPEAYQKLLNEFFQAYPLKQRRAIFVLSAEVLFKKELPQTDTSDLEKAVNHFFEVVPFDDETEAKKIIRGGDKILLIAANKEYYFPVKDLLEQLGSTVITVVPINLLMTPASALSLQPEEVRKILNSLQSVKNANLMNEDSLQTLQPVPSTENNDQINESRTVQVPPQPNHFTFRRYLIIISIFFLSVALISLLLFIRGSLPFLNSLQQPSSYPLSELTPSPTIAQPSATPTPAISFLPKEELKIEVLNGSGVAGQAGKIKEQLIALGFKDIETGNQASSSGQTEVSFSRLVSREIQQEILDFLKNNFSALASPSAQLNASLDIQITTGK